MLKLSAFAWRAFITKGVEYTAECYSGAETEGARVRLIISGNRG